MTDPHFPSSGRKESKHRTPGSIRVLVLGPHALVRSGIRALLERFEELEVGEATDLQQSLALVEESDPDVVLLDVVKPGIGGLELLTQVSQRFPSTRVIVLARPEDQEQVAHALSQGAAGLVAKTAEVGELDFAIRAVARGERYLSENLRQSAVNYSQDPPVSLAALTPRQCEVLKLMVEGHTTKEIARRLNISRKTVETHRARIMERLSIRDIASLVRYALRVGLIKLSE